MPRTAQTNLLSMLVPSFGLELASAKLWRGDLWIPRHNLAPDLGMVLDRMLRVGVDVLDLFGELVADLWVQIPDVPCIAFQDADRVRDKSRDVHLVLAFDCVALDIVVG